MHPGLRTRWSVKEVFQTLRSAFLQHSNDQNCAREKKRRLLARSIDYIKEFLACERWRERYRLATLPSGGQVSVQLPGEPLLAQLAPLLPG